MPTQAPRAPRADLQRRVIRTLVMSQVLGGVGMASGIAVGALLAEQLTGSSTYAGLGTTSQVLGAALISIPMARLMARRGRRVGLQFGYALAFTGAALILTAGVAGSFPLMIAGSLLFGGGTSSGGQARYAAADLAEEHHRGRDLSIVVWATTIGSVLGPNLVGPGQALARRLGIPELTGSYVFSLAGFVLAFLVVNRLLRPDPLLTSRALDRADALVAARRHTSTDATATEYAEQLEPLDALGPSEVERETEPDLHHDGSVSRGLRVVRSNVGALLGLLVTGLGHAVMVSVMVMTPIHMKHGHAELRVIGFVISMHILGMYVLSPVVGIAVDRWGPRPIALAGGVVLTVAALLAAQAEEGWSGLLLGALFLLGVGWSFTLVSGSTMLTASVGPEERPAVQGVSEVFMGLAGAGGGAAAGVVVDALGYGTLATGAAFLAITITVLAATLRAR